MNAPTDLPSRGATAFLHTLQLASEKAGHTHLPWEVLIMHTQRLLSSSGVEKFLALQRPLAAMQICLHACISDLECHYCHLLCLRDLMSLLPAVLRTLLPKVHPRCSRAPEISFSAMDICKGTTLVILFNIVCRAAMEGRGASEGHSAAPAEVWPHCGRGPAGRAADGAEARGARAARPAADLWRLHVGRRIR